MSSIIGNANTNKQLDVNQSELTNTNHNIASQDPNEADQTFKQTERKTGNKSLNEFQSSTADEKKEPAKDNEKAKENMKEDVNKTIAELNKAQEKLQELEKRKKNLEQESNKLKETVEEKQKNLETFEKSWIIGKLKTGLQKSTWGQRLQTFAKIAITFAISITASVMSGGLVPALLVASLSIGLLYGIAKNVINIAKEKLTSELSEACQEVINSSSKEIKNANDFILTYANEAKTKIGECIDNLEKQKTSIYNLNEQIKNLNKNFQKEIESKNDQINKQEKEIAEITKDLASTISSSLGSSAKVIEKAKANINKIEKAEKDIRAITGDCNEISQKSQKIKSLSDGITNKIEKFNKTTIDKLKKFVETKTVFEKSKSSKLLSKEGTTKDNTERLSKKIDDPKDKISKQKLDELYSKAGFSAEESEDSNETIKKLIDKISESKVDQTEFAKLLVEITKDQSQMNEEIKKSSLEISKLAEEINKDHAEKTKELIIQISNVLSDIGKNEVKILNEQKTLTKNYLSSAKKVFDEFLEKDEKARLNYLQEEFCKHYLKDSNKCFSKEFFDEVVQIINQANEAEVESLASTQLDGVNEILSRIMMYDEKHINEKVNDLIKEGFGLRDVFHTLEEINSLNATCKSSLFEINDKDIGGIIANTVRINKSVEEIQKHAKSLKIETTGKSSNIAKVSAGTCAGMIAGGLAGPIAVAVGTIGLVSIGIGKIIQTMKSHKK